MTPKRPHSTAIVQEALRLHEGGWSARGIARILRQRGIVVSDSTIGTWVDPSILERRRAKARTRARREWAARCGGRLASGPRRSPEFRLARMQSLQQLGLSIQAIATVMTFDFPDQPLTVWQVRRALERGTFDRTRAAQPRLKAVA